MSQNAIHLEPGPTIIHDSVVTALAQQPIYHQSSEFAGILDDATELLRSFYDTSDEVVILPSSGRGAVEAALLSIDHVDRTLVVPTNGTFGRMLASVGRSIGMNVTEIAHDSGEVFDHERIVGALADHHRPVLAMVHNETSTGMINSLEGMADLVHDREGLFAVDAVSSLGGTPIRMDANGVDLCASASQKSVGAPPGLGFVALSPRGITEVDSRTDKAGFYLDLRRWWDQWLPVDRGGRLASGYRRLPWTAPTNIVVALSTALHLSAGENKEATWSRHERIAAALRTAMRGLGGTPLAPVGYESPTVGAFRLTDVDVKTVKSRLASVHNVFVATGMDSDASTSLRFAHMAESAREAPHVTLLNALAVELAELGHQVADDPASVFLQALSASEAEPDQSTPAQQAPPYA